MTPEEIVLEHMASIERLDETVTQLKANHDRATELLRECMTYSSIGEHGMFKTKVRDFLDSLGTRH